MRLQLLCMNVIQYKKHDLHSFYLHFSIKYTEINIILYLYYYYFLFIVYKIGKNKWMYMNEFVDDTHDLLYSINNKCYL